MEPDEGLAGIDPDSLISLSVGWRSGLKLRMAQMMLGDDVVTQFRQLVADTLDNVEERSSEPWTPEADLTPETYLTLNRGLLGDAPLLASEHDAESFADLLLAPEALPVLAPNSLPARDLELYSIAVGSEPGQRAAFVRRSNPRRGLRAGRFLTSYHDVLVKIDDPVFGFDLDIDLIFVGESVHVLSQTTFAKLFRDQATLTGRVPAWTEAVAGHIPMAPEGRARLEARVLRDSRFARRLENIANRGHLEGITTEEIRTKMAAVGLDHEVLINGQGELSLEEEHISSVLHFLNEDLFYGVLTNAGFRADRKAMR